MPKISVLTPSIRPEGLKYNLEALQKQTFTDFEWLVEIGIPPTHDLNAAYNRMLRRAKGELIVSMQDFSRCTPEGLQKFWDAYQADPKTFFTAPLGKTMDWKEVKWDWRAYADAKPDWKCWEIDWGCAPLAALKEIGGFDEALDEFWSCDNVNVGYRAHLAGYKVKHLFDNPAVALDHDQIMSHPFRERFKPEFNSMRMDWFTAGNKINYLD